MTGFFISLSLRWLFVLFCCHEVLFVSFGRKEMYKYGIKGWETEEGFWSNLLRASSVRGVSQLKMKSQFIFALITVPYLASPFLPKRARVLLQDQYKICPAVVCQSISLSQHLKCLRVLAIFMKGLLLTHEYYTHAE